MMKRSMFWLTSLLVAAGALPASAGVQPPSLPAWTVVGPDHSRISGLVVSPDDTQVIVAGAANANASPRTWLASFDASTGDEQWSFTSQYPSHGNAVGVSPNGTRVAVGGWVAPSGGGDRQGQMAIWMLDRTGANLWSARFTGDGADRGDSVADLVFSPDSRTVYVTGVTWFAGRRRDLVVAAYNANTGRLRWRRVIDSGRSNATSGSRGISEEGRAIAVTRDGATVIVTGYNARPAALGDERSQAVTLALAARDGKTRWSKNSTAANDPDVTPSGETIALRGSSVYVGGGNWYIGNERGFAAKHALGSGQRLWSKLQTSGAQVATRVTAIAADAGRIYLTGPTTDPQGTRFHAWSQRADNGAAAWTTGAELRGAARDLTLGSDGILYVAGDLVVNGSSTQRITVLGLDPADGSTSWLREHVASPGTSESASQVAVTSDANRIFVAGTQTQVSTPRALIVAFDR